MDKDGAARVRILDWGHLGRRPTPLAGHPSPYISWEGTYMGRRARTWGGEFLSSAMSLPSLSLSLLLSLLNITIREEVLTNIKP
jgi:hypothetical protein